MEGLSLDNRDMPAGLCSENPATIFPGTLFRYSGSMENCRIKKPEFCLLFSLKTAENGRSEGIR